MNAVGREHRSGQTETGEDRLGQVEHRGEAVVEGDGERLAAGGSSTASVNRAPRHPARTSRDSWRSSVSGDTENVAFQVGLTA